MMGQPVEGQLAGRQQTDVPRQKQTQPNKPQTNYKKPQALNSFVKKTPARILTKPRTTGHRVQSVRPNSRPTLLVSHLRCPILLLAQNLPTPQQLSMPCTARPSQCLCDPTNPAENFLRTQIPSRFLHRLMVLFTPALVTIFALLFPTIFHSTFQSSFALLQCSVAMFSVAV